VNVLLQATEKYVAVTANYAKDKGSMFMDWMLRCHSTSYIYPVARACDGSRQDIGVEGAGPVLINIPCYLEFLVWRISSGGDGILEKNLYTLFRSVELISLLRVLPIFHISLCLPLRWLAGNCGDLIDYDFGVADMPWALELMDEAFSKIMVNEELFLDDDFVMSIFTPILDKIKPFKNYLLYMFEEK